MFSAAQHDRKSMCKQAALQQDHWWHLLLQWTKAAHVGGCLCPMSHLHLFQVSVCTAWLNHCNPFEKQMVACLQPWLVFALHRQHFAGGDIVWQRRRDIISNIEQGLSPFSPASLSSSSSSSSSPSDIRFCKWRFFLGACKYVHTSQAACQVRQGICAKG